MPLSLLNIGIPGCCPSCWTAWGEFIERFISPAFLGLLGHLLQMGALKLSQQTSGLWAVFGSFCHRAGCNWDLWQLPPVCARWFDLLLLLPGDHCIVLQMHIWLASFSHSKVRQFSFMYCPQIYETNSGICHFPALGGWLSPKPGCQSLFLIQSPLAESSDPCLTPCFLRLVQCSTLTPLSVLD
jgi:hypothetical protein